MTDRPDSAPVTLASIRAEAESMLTDAPSGDDLDPIATALLRFAVHAAVSALDTDGMDQLIRAALDAGATLAQAHETLVVVSGLGVHTLMEGSRRVLAAGIERGEAPTGQLDADRATLRDRYQGESSYWVEFEREVPGFLDALLHLSPEAYQAFFDYCAVPWRTGAVPGRVKELMSMATDATPTHRYLPGMRLHLGNALKLGAGRTAILHALDIGATAPAHAGVRGTR